MVDLLAESAQFLTQTYTELAWTGLAERLSAVRAEIARSGSYTLTPQELAHGCRLAWRHSTRCVGRAYWQSLRVRDLRHVTEPQDVFAALVEHLRLSYNGGLIQPTISVFGPGVRVLNDQLIRYAGYVRADGSVLGDPQNVALTSRLRALGWAGGSGTPFDVLPLAIEQRGQVHLFELPPDAVQEVPITHPDHPWFAELAWRRAGQFGPCPPGWTLRWHALPVISNLRLEIGGLSFGCAPFSGWYLETEIGARNLADAGRYDLLPEVARALGLNMSSERTLWRDRALIELNAAVLSSFDAAGVRLSDHHTVTRHFVRFEARERALGRAVYGRWSWLVPPLSPATTAVYHRQYEDVELTPNFFPAEGGGCPVH
jgi:nitric-oxide synthase, bacterial